MVLHIANSFLEKYVPTKYYLPIAVGTLSIYITKAWFSGRKTTRERDLHGRTVLLTGATSSLGFTLLTALAKRGAQIIAVVPDTSDPTLMSMIDLVRFTTDNELIYAEQCDMSSPNAIKEFCAQLIKSSGGGLQSEPPRLDAVVFAHEYTHIGALNATASEQNREHTLRREGRLATFFWTTLLLPVLLTAPEDRDIRFINIVSPFYAAAVPSFSPNVSQKEGSSSPRSGKGTSVWLEEGKRSLEAILHTRHLQRILDALPAPSIRADSTPQSKQQAQQQQQKPQESQNHQQQQQQKKKDKQKHDTESVAESATAVKRPSNILAVSVSPGISRWDTVGPYLRADKTSPMYSTIGLLCYAVVLPFLYVFAKSSEAAIQSVLHALFLPTPLKTTTRAGSTGQDHDRHSAATTEELLRGGALYAECNCVSLSRDGETRLGGEEVGRMVWESLEAELAEWRKAEDVKAASAPKQGQKTHG
ncbi:hypothetical protein FRC19_009659 [Serendipita sp. 401]|nr:hypothetical protein FRC19_009659 [Serendipita sp. 401]